MAVRAGIVKCPFCSAHLQDTKQEFIDCKYCGKRFKRGIAKEKEEELRRNMVLDLSDKVQKMKVIMSAGKIFGILFIILAVIWLFSEAFEFMEIAVFSMLIVNGVVWFAVSGFYGSKLEKTQSKMFDLTGGRGVFEY
jgi:DNA-directed RNA polymerase subunit RPC12/RpoP